MIDEVLVMIMKGPRSYTGEDTVEIDCHGGVLAMKKVLEAVIHAGARPAEPGEFTKRAFLNGRIDLSQAEAVIDVIQAKNEYALKSSLSQLKGSVLTSFSVHTHSSPGSVLTSIKEIRKQYTVPYCIYRIRT